MILTLLIMLVSASETIAAGLLFLGGVSLLAEVIDFFLFLPSSPAFGTTFKNSNLGTFSMLNEINLNLLIKIFVLRSYLPGHAYIRI
jgi:hypothetical protein